MNSRQTARLLAERAASGARTPGRILVADHDGMYLIKFVGDVRVNLCAAVDDFLAEMFRDEDFKSVLVDLTATEGIDSTSLGILAKLSIKASDLYGFTPTLVSTNSDITRVLRTVGFDDVFHIVEKPLVDEAQIAELPQAETSVENLRRRVLEAHRALMGLNESNQEKFRDLVATLEAVRPSDRQPY